MQPYVNTSGLLALLIPLVSASALAGLSVTLRERHKGWRHVSPGFGYWLGFGLGVGLAALITWVWADVGSSRSDGDSQMRIAWWLAFIFSLMAFWCGWRILSLERQGLRWRGEQVIWRQAGKLLERPLRGATDIRGRFGGSSRVMFNNGDVLTIDIAAHNASQLIVRIEELNGLADPDAPPEH